MGGVKSTVRSGLIAALLFVMTFMGCEDMGLRNASLAAIASHVSPENAANPSVLAAPSYLTALYTSGTTIHLVWVDNSDNETGFGIQRSPDGATFTLVQYVPANTTTWDDAYSGSGTPVYKVLAFDSAGDAAFSAAAKTGAAWHLIAISSANDSFMMGDDTYGPNPNKSESFSYSFSMSKYETTNDDFSGFISSGGYALKRYWTTNGWAAKEAGGWTEPLFWTDSIFGNSPTTSSQPVVGISWYEAVAFCNWRSEREGLAPAYDSAGAIVTTADGYRLPTETEWEYAAAKGASDEPERKYPSGDTFYDYNLGSATSPAAVGTSFSYPATPQGLYDLEGNVGEWCSDNYQPDSAIAGTTDRYYFVDDSASQTFCFRGGAWDSTDAKYLRCAYRDSKSPASRTNDLGFRVVNANE